MSFFIVIVICFALNAAEFSELVDGAKNAYTNRNYEEAISMLENAKQIALSEHLKMERVNILRFQAGMS